MGPRGRGTLPVQGRPRRPGRAPHRHARRPYRRRSEAAAAAARQDLVDHAPAGHRFHGTRYPPHHGPREGAGAERRGSPCASIGSRDRSRGSEDLSPEALRPSALLDRVPSRRVCIVLLTGIGDVVHGLPIANDLKRDDPTRTVVWVAEPAPARVLEHHPSVDEIVVFNKERGVSGVIELARALRGRPCDVTLNMQRYLKGVFPSMLSGAPIRVGLPPSKTREGVRFFNTHHLAERPWCHTQDLLLGYRDALGLDSGAPVEWGITFSEEEREAQARFFQPFAGRPVAGVVLATANPRKDWPVGRYPALFDCLHALGYRVVLIGGPSARERAAAARVMTAAGPQHTPEMRPGLALGLGDSVRAMMWMVDGVDLLVSPDTGPLHLAHALGTPVVGLFGHTNPARVGPWKRYRDLVVDGYTEPGNAPDATEYEPKPGRMEKIGVEDVLERVERARDRYGVRKTATA
ncbi:MAG: lipopolysaccharide heptosyltransferase family protein [Gemmatimonadetes bacterium]|nr:lipopolysaccharide heptosyltransferase family protein [Gemmatimonadota bacterium]